MSLLIIISPLRKRKIKVLIQCPLGKCPILFNASKVHSSALNGGGGGGVHIKWNGPITHLPKVEAMRPKL